MSLKPVTIQVLVNCPSCHSLRVYVDLAMRDQYCNNCGHAWSLKSVDNLRPAPPANLDAALATTPPNPDQTSLLPPEQGA